MDSGIAALLGTLIGSSISIVVVIMQRKIEFRKETMRIAYEMAKENMSQYMELYKGRNIKLDPIEIYYDYHFRFLMLVNKKGGVTTQELENLRSDHKMFRDYFARQAENDY